MHRHLRKPPKEGHSVIELPAVDEPKTSGLLTGAKMHIFEDALRENGVTDPLSVGLAKAEYLIGEDVDAFLQYEFEKRFAAFVLDPADPDRVRLRWHVPGDLSLSQERMMQVPGVETYIRDISGRFLHAAKAAASADTWFAGARANGGYSYFGPRSMRDLRAHRKELLNLQHSAENARVKDPRPPDAVTGAYRSLPRRMAGYVKTSTLLDSR